LWRAGWPGVMLVAGVTLAVLVVARRRRRPAPRVEPQPVATTFETVIQELGAIKAALQDGGARTEQVSRLLHSAAWLEHRGRELLGREVSAGLRA
jgi:hypothetical protein